jgi:hypothetical protein
LAPAIAWILLRRRSERADDPKEFVVLPVLVVCATVLTLSVLPWTFFRYTIHLVPLVVLLLALLVWELWRRHRLLGLSLLLLLMFTNVLSTPLPPHRLRFDFLSFLYEITHDYDGPNEGIVEYLKEHGSEDQLVLTNYGQLPIIFYTNARAIGFGQDLRVPETADWIIARRGRGGQHHLRDSSRGYEPIVLDVPDIRWGNRPDPFYHQYRTVREGPRVVIYRKR